MNASGGIGAPPGMGGGGGRGDFMMEEEEEGKSRWVRTQANRCIDSVVGHTDGRLPSFNHNGLTMPPPPTHHKQNNDSRPTPSPPSGSAGGCAACHHKQRQRASLDSFKLLKVIGKGSFGKVWVWCGVWA